MKKLRSLMVVFTLALMLVNTFGGSTVTAFAATVSEVQEYTDWATHLHNWAATKLSDTSFNRNGDSSVTMEEVKDCIKDTDTKYDAARDEFRTYMTNLGVVKASKSEQVDEKIKDITDKVGISADLEGGSAWLSDTTIKLISQIIGFLTVIVLMAVGLFTAVDIMFLTIPPLHTALEEKAAASGKTDKNGNPKPRIVSTDACAAWHDAAESGKNVLLIYLKKRAIAYVAIAIVVYMLLSGNLTAIITLVLKLISGALDAVESLNK